MACWRYGFAAPSGHDCPFGWTMHKTILGAALCLASASASAMNIDAQGMARFDHSYVSCEAKYPQMRGARDEAYLSMWRVKADAKSRSELAAVRKGAAYQAETRRIRDEEAKKGAPPASTLEAQCQALWAETQRVRNLAGK